MMNNKIHSARGFWIFVILHVLCWTLAPVFLRYTLPMDAMEGATWGHQLSWGYDKNPFLNAALTRLALFLGGGTGWMIYLFSQISVGTCFWAVWQLGKKMLPPMAALFAVMMLEGLQYYNFHAIDFNDNTLELSFWALTVFFYYEALTIKYLRFWLLTGLFAGLSLMAKYYSALLLLALFLFPVLEQSARRIFYEKGIYAAALVCFLVILPHVCWLFSHDFVTLRYVDARVGAEHQWLDHLFYPFGFLLQQFEVLIPGLVLLLPFWLIRQKNTTGVREKVLPLDAFAWRFLLCAGLGPLCLTILLSLLAGFKLRAGWGQPLLSYSGILLFSFLQPVITRERITGFLLLWMIFFIAMLTGYAISLISAQNESSAIFPGKRIAAAIENDWHARYHTHLMYVAGPRWLAGNIAFYAKDQPAVFMEWNAQASPWISGQALRAAGAVFVWDSKAISGVSSPAIVQKKFPRMEAVRHLQFPWWRNQKLPPVDVWVAILPPGGMKKKYQDAQA
jgi:4-amino-4-deoxy-L-arabinose transferase-like glycosyltransferase